MFLFRSKSNGEERHAAATCTAIDSITDQDVVELAERMQRGVTVKNRMYRFRRYEQCFVGQEAVQWMIDSGAACDVAAAIAIGNRMLQLGLLHHVVFEHNFDNKYLFYNFAMPQPAGGEDSMHSMSDSTACEEQQAGTRGDASHGDDDDENALHARMRELTQQMEMQAALNATMMEAMTREHAQHASMMHALRLRAARADVITAITTACVAAIVFQGVDGVVHVLCMLLLACTAWQLLMSSMLRNSWRMLSHAIMSVAKQHSTAWWPAAQQVQATDSPMWDSPRSFSSFSSQDMQHSSSDAQQHNAKPSASAPTSDDFERWPQNAPLMVRMKALPYQQTVRDDDAHGVLIANSGVAMEFETDLFRGRILLQLRGVANTPSSLFKGQRRRSHLVVQGQFKRELPFDDVLTGQEFSSPLRRLPSSWLLHSMSRIAHNLAPSLAFGSLTQPHFLTPLVAAAQAITVSEPHACPDITSPPIEDMTLLGKQFSVPIESKPGSLPATRRKRMLSKPINRRGMRFTTQHVWTMHFWQHLLDAATYTLDLSIAKIDLLQHVDGQPLQLMSKSRKHSQYLWNFEMWHKDMSLPP